MTIHLRIRSAETPQSDVVHIKGTARILFNIPPSRNGNGSQSLGIEVLPGSDRIRAQMYRAGDSGPTMEIDRHSTGTISAEYASDCFFLELEGVVGVRLRLGSEAGEGSSSQGWFWIEPVPTADYATPIVCGTL